MEAERIQPVRLIGRYAIYGEIAAGGMASVCFGRLVGPVGFGRTVAIKRLHPPYARDPAVVAMFLDEARLSARVRHTNVVQTIDVVALEGELFVIMEYVHGESLARLMQGTGIARIPSKVATAVVVNVLHGLHAAHEARDARGQPLHVVHRDVSPHNIIVGADGVARVLDFGIAHAEGRSRSIPDAESKGAGKLAYMAPEQLAGETVGRAADVFASSVVLWELLTGRRLFEESSPQDLMERVRSAKYPAPSAFVTAVPPSLDEIVLRGLARNPAERWQTAREMAVAIERSVGVATASTVGGWVELVGGPSLAARAELLSLIEQSCASDENAQPSDVASREILRTPITRSPLDIESAPTLPAGAAVPRVQYASTANASGRGSSASMKRGGRSSRTPRTPSKVPPTLRPFGVDADGAPRSFFPSADGWSRATIAIAVATSCALGVALGVVARPQHRMRNVAAATQPMAPIDVPSVIGPMPPSSLRIAPPPEGAWPEALPAPSSSAPAPSASSSLPAKVRSKTRALPK